jgi:hypothetical protein
MAVGLIGSLFGQKQPAALAGAPMQTTGNTLETVLERLKKHDENLVGDLAAFAELAENSPDTFKLVLQQLRAM